MSEHTVDARGLNCPLPILRVKKAISLASAGDLIRMTATDPGSVKDIESFCKQTGNELLASEQHGGEFAFAIRKR